MADASKKSKKNPQDDDERRHGGGLVSSHSAEEEPPGVPPTSGGEKQPHLRRPSSTISFAALPAGRFAREEDEEDEGMDGRILLRGAIGSVFEEAKWTAMYETGRTPWDTGSPASQLVAYASRGEIHGKVCVELCCGTGASSVFLAEHGAAFVVGADVSSAAICRARELAEKRGVAHKCAFVALDLLSDNAVSVLLESHPGRCTLGTTTSSSKGGEHPREEDQSCRQAAPRPVSLGGSSSSSASSTAAEKAKPTPTACIEDDSSDASESSVLFDLAFDCQGFQILCAADSERAGACVAKLVKRGGHFLTIAGNAHEYRAYEGGSTSLSVPELVGALSPPFSLISLSETRFDGGEFLDDDAPLFLDDGTAQTSPQRLVGKDSDDPPPLAWRALFKKTSTHHKTLQHSRHTDGSASASSLNGSVSTSGGYFFHNAYFAADRESSLSFAASAAAQASPRSQHSSSTKGERQRTWGRNNNNHANNNKGPTPRRKVKHRSTKPPEIVARQLTTSGSPFVDDDRASSTHFDDAVDAALSVDGSVAPSECSDAQSAFAGADGFEDVAAARAAAARQERQRLEGDVPWVRWWEKRSKAYDALTRAQPVVSLLASRVAKVALYYAFRASVRRKERWNVADFDASPCLRDGDDLALKGATEILAVDLAAGAGLCSWALAEAVAETRGNAVSSSRGKEQQQQQLGALQRSSLRAPCVRVDLVEPSHSMAALARARASRCRYYHPRSLATVWQVPVERCQDRLPVRRRENVDVMTCANAMECLNYYDVFEAAAALLRPGGALCFDLPAELYEETVGNKDETEAAWVPCVLAALKDRGVNNDDVTRETVVNLASKPHYWHNTLSRPFPMSASSLAAAANAAGLRLARCDVAEDDVPGDYFVACRAISTSWLTEPFSDMPKSDAVQLRNVVVLDAARRAATRTARLKTVVVVVVKPPDTVSSSSSSNTGGGSNNNVAPTTTSASPAQGADDGLSGTPSSGVPAASSAATTSSSQTSPSGAFLTDDDATARANASSSLTTAPHNNTTAAVAGGGAPAAADGSYAHDDDDKRSEKTAADAPGRWRALTNSQRFWLDGDQGCRPIIAALNDDHFGVDAEAAHAAETAVAGVAPADKANKPDDA